ncbi:hypothetical protein C0995_004210 [Termitomyces sp. Mi166|nr:hypothetical protein C0995_004210 [Termitomyces sp. Mi166\
MQSRLPVTKQSNCAPPTCAGPASQVIAMLPAGKGKAVDSEEHPCWSAKEKGKGKAKDPEPSAMADEEVTSLLQCFHNARVPEEIHDELLDSHLVQLAFIQLLNELDTTGQQHNEACAALFWQASGKSKNAITLPTAPGLKKACYQVPSLCLKASQPSARGPVLPYSEKEVLRDDDDKAMDLHPDLIRVHEPEPALGTVSCDPEVAKETAKPIINMKSVATETIAFPHNVPQSMDKGSIQRDYSHLTLQASGSQGGEHYPTGLEDDVSDYSGSELEDKEIEPDDNTNIRHLKLLKNKKKASQHEANMQK